jgi:hypothetical protein
VDGAVSGTVVSSIFLKAVLAFLNVALPDVTGLARQIPPDMCQRICDMSVLQGWIF